MTTNGSMVLAAIAAAMLVTNGARAQDLGTDPARPPATGTPSPSTDPDELEARRAAAWAEIGGGIGLIAAGLALGGGAAAVGVESEVHATVSCGWLGTSSCRRVVGRDDGLLAAAIGMGNVALAAALVGAFRLLLPARIRLRRLDSLRERSGSLSRLTVSGIVSQDGASVAIALAF